LLPWPWRAQQICAAVQPELLHLVQSPAPTQPMQAWVPQQIPPSGATDGHVSCAESLLTSLPPSEPPLLDDDEPSPESKLTSGMDEQAEASKATVATATAERKRTPRRFKT
jgi:hypothetical protein